MLLPILEYPDERLRIKAMPVPIVTADEIQSLIDNMLETMYEAAGVGLAATQVNVHERVIVLDVSEKRNEPLVLVNPKIERFAGWQELEEGCLSVPGKFATVQRSKSIGFKALDRNGSPFTMDAEGFLATVVQHECDHLEGRVFVDHLSRQRRRRLLR